MCRKQFYYAGNWNLFPFITLNHERGKAKEDSPVHVNVKEIGIKACLYNARDDGNPFDVAFDSKSVDPVENVQATVGTQRSKIVRCNCLGFSCPLQLKELR